MAVKVLICGDFSVYPIDFKPLFEELLARIPLAYLAYLESIRLVDQFSYLIFVQKWRG